MKKCVICSVLILAVMETACSKGPPASAPENAGHEAGASGGTEGHELAKVSWPDGVPKERTVELGAGVKMELMLIPAGEFLMGSPDEEPAANCEDEKPLHKVQITQPFYLGKYEVTQEQWQAVMGYNPSAFSGPKNPVECVSWEECQIFLERLNAKSAAGGVKFCLPTEAQWEYACRAGAATRWNWGDDPAQIGDYAAWAGNSRGGSAPVGQKKPNAWGLYDMHGNVWEWCADWCAVGYYGQSPAQDPTGPTSPEGVQGRGPSPVFRGGSWFNRRPEELRCAQRGVRCGPGGVLPSDDPWNGFRVAGRLEAAPGTKAGTASAPPDGQGAARDVIRFSYHIHPAVPFRVDTVAADGSVQIRPYWELWKRGRQETFLWGLSPDMLYATLAKAKGCALLGFNGFPSPDMDVMQSYNVVPQPSEDLRLFRVQVLDLLADGKPAVPLNPEAARRSKVDVRQAVIRLGPQAAKHLKAGDQLFLSWPGGATPQQLRAVPDVVPLVDARGGEEGTTQRPSAGLNQSLNNLKQIALAMHNFHDAYKHLPPAVVYGPDGKPWHSWRVLILPFVEQRALYDRYRFDEPWDGPNNKALLASIPALYRDPVYPNAQDACTHYAAVAGPGTAFPLEPRQPVTFLRTPAGLSAASARMADVRDGTSNTLLVGSVSSERNIPWMKPEDVTWNENFPRLGKPGGFAAPHKFGQFAAGVFARVDGSVTALRDDVDPADWRRLLQVADGQPLGQIPVFPSPTAIARRAEGTPLLEIPIDQPGASARLVLVPHVPPPVSARQQSLNNFKQIGLAIHNFHDVYKHFPPAVIYGPDGKPWHSWRVLLLPFLEQRALYDRYRFDEPWDGPNNKPLLESVPPVYRDPVYPGSKDGFTHYAAITGQGTAFPTEPRKPVSFVPKPAGSSAATTRLADIRDGTSNTIVVGPVSPEHKILWTKPEDVMWNENFPKLGQPGSFATPHKLDNRPAAFFLRADGSVSMERADLDLAALRKLFQVADAPRPDESKARVAVPPRATPGPLLVPLAARLPAFLTAERKQRNLLKDASFENAAGNDWSASTWRGNPQAVTRVDGGREGQRAVRLHTTVADDVQYRQRVAVKPQTRYLLSGWIKTQGVQIVEKGGTQSANLAVDGNGTWEATAPVLGDTDWTYVTLAFDSGERTEVGVAARLGFFYSTVTGTAWYDDLCLIELEDLKKPGEKPDAGHAGDRGLKEAVRGVKFLGMTLVDPSKELMSRYGLPDQYPGPIIVEQMKDSPNWGPFGPPPGPGCAFWLVQNPAYGSFFNEERSPSYTPQTVQELAKAILACTASPEEYEKIWDAMRRRCREQAEKLTDNPEQRARLLKIAEATVPKEDAGKYICRVVYHYPNSGGTMTTYIRLGKEDLDQLRGIQQGRSDVIRRSDKAEEDGTDLDAFRRLQQEGLKTKDE